MPVELKDFEVVKRRSRAPALTPEVTVQRGGTIGFNSAAMAALGHPSRVIFLVRSDPPALLIQASGEAPDSYAVQRNGRGGVSNAKAAISLLRIDHSTARRYPAEVVADGSLLVDLSEPGVPARGAD